MEISIFPKMYVFPLKSNLRWSQFDLDPDPKSMDPPFMQKSTRSNRDTSQKTPLVVYDLQFFALFHHFQWIMPNFVAKNIVQKYLKSNNTLLRLNLQGTSVHLLNAHISAEIQCVAGPMSKIPENLICYSHAPNKFIQTGTFQDPPRQHVSCHHHWIQHQQKEGSVNRAIWHIQPGSNTFHTFIYSPSIHIALNIGAI